jgi:hypothetical protein
VVLPASMCAMIPMLRVLASSAFVAMVSLVFLAYCGLAPAGGVAAYQR